MGSVTLVNACRLDEQTIESILRKYSDGLNDENNELGWQYRVVPLRNRGPLAVLHPAP